MVVECSEVLKELPEVFFSQIVDRSAETRIPIIRKFIKKGSTIHSDCWRSHTSLEADAYLHFTVEETVQ